MWLALQKRWWLIPAVVTAYAAVSLGISAGFAAAAFGNVVQSVLLLALMGVLLWNARTAQGYARLFWANMALGAWLWLAATLMWTWFEVVVRKPVPVPFVGDVLFFLHIVPLMGALALRPHRGERHARLDFGGLDFMLLLLWWVYLYTVIVIPWQYVHPDSGQYGLSFNLLYVLENSIFLAALAMLYLRTTGGWRRIYAGLLLAGIVYAIGSQMVNRAITRGTYYTGSIYDVPLVLGMMIFIGVGVLAQAAPPEPMQEPGTPVQGVLASRLAMFAVLSLPFMALWVNYAAAPSEVKSFRGIVIMSALVVLPFLVFLKQHLLDRELMRLWRESQRNYENLKRLQAQLVQAEKLASLTQLVSGAAHEINNPLTAILGYSELLDDDQSIPPERRPFIAKIGQQARRIREVVSSLRAFAKQIPGEKARVEINPLVVDAIELHMLDPQGSQIQIEQELAPDLPHIMGDTNGLLQVCFHIIGNAIDALKQVGGGVLRVSTRRQKDQIIIEFADTGSGVKEPTRIFDPFYSTKPFGKGTGLGLSACYGIVQNHGGEIVCENQPGGGTKFTVVLPSEQAEARPKAMAASAR